MKEKERGKEGNGEILSKKTSVFDLLDFLF